METRKITIVSTSTQKKSVIETAATTLAELKRDLGAAGVDYMGMTFYEGLTHTELLTDEAILPHDVPYKGTTTNELVFMLTNPNKKIRSGALSDVRAALYEVIEEKGLESVVSERYGKNYTNCKNSELAAIVDEFTTPESVDEKCLCSNVAEALIALVDLLNEDDYLSDAEADTIKNMVASAPKVAVPYSDSEIDSMFDFIN